MKRKRKSNEKYQLLVGSTIRTFCFDSELCIRHRAESTGFWGKASVPERKKARFSQEKLAEKAGLTRNYIGDIERAEKKVTLEALAKIAKALKCRVRDLAWDV